MLNTDTLLDGLDKSKYISLLLELKFTLSIFKSKLQAGYSTLIIMSMTKVIFSNFISYYKLCMYNWRASVASETVTGVTQLKIGDVCLFIYMDV